MCHIFQTRQDEDYTSPKKEIPLRPPTVTEMFLCHAVFGPNTTQHRWVLTPSGLSFRVLFDPLPLLLLGFLTTAARRSLP